LPTKLLEDHLLSNAQKGLVEADEEIVQQALSDIAHALCGVYKKRKSHFPRASALGYGARRLWFMRNNPDVSEDLSEMTQTFLMGHVLEAVEIFLMKMAGYEIRNVQAHGIAKFGEIDVPGSIDLEMKLDGEWKVVDIKTANNWAYGDKWKDAETLLAKDTYGYIEQAAVYERIRGLEFAGWWVINKDNYAKKFISAEPIRGDIDRAKQRIEANLKLAHEKEMPEPCHDIEAETYHPKNKNTRAECKTVFNLVELEDGSFLTGNYKTKTECARCPFNKTCFPTGKPATRGKTKLLYIGEIGFEIPGVKIVEEE
jgi:hypothetical protein